MSEALRLLVVSNLYPPAQIGGYELSCASFVQFARGQGHHVEVLTATGGADLHDQQVHRRLEMYVAADAELGPVGHVERARIEWRVRRVFDETCGAVRPDAVMWWNLKGLPTSMVQRAANAGLPAVGAVCDRWMLAAQAADPWLRTGRRIGRAAALLDAVGLPARIDWSAASRWAFVSRYLSEEVQRALGPLAHTSIAHSGIDVSSFERRPRRPYAGRALFVGRLSPDKGVETALEALSDLPDHSLTVCGTASCERIAALRQVSTDLRVADRVRWLGALPPGEVASLYADHDVVLFPIAWDEPWGKVPLEAMAAGVPVIATSRGGAQEYLVDGKNCLTASSAAEFAEATTALRDGDGLRAQLVKHGFETASRYDLSGVNSRRLDLITDAVAARRRQPAC